MQVGGQRSERRDPHRRAGRYVTDERLIPVDLHRRPQANMVIRRRKPSGQIDDDRLVLP